jgi:DNA-binding NarL/FixJ family response regulator
MIASEPDREPAERAPTRRVLLVDDHPVVRDGYALAINARPDLEVCGEAADADEAIEAVTTTDPDIVLLDLSLRGADGMDVIGLIKEKRPRLPILIVSMHDESTHALPALRAGARGYVMKEEDISVVIKAIHTVLDGRTFVSDEVKSGILDLVAGDSQTESSPKDLLTPRELEIFERIGQGQTLRAIAADFHISLRTAETHRNRMKNKLGVDSVVELQHRAFQWANRILKD